MAKKEVGTYCELAIEALEQEYCQDCISKQAVCDFIRSLPKWCVKSEDGKFSNVGLLYDDVMFGIDKLPTAIPKRKPGEWLRMSDLSEQEDDRYKCSYCGNVVHYKNKINLYTFNSWCGRCGSDNGKRRDEADNDNKI